MMQLLPAGFDAALVGEFTQQALEFDPAVVFQIEGARNLTGTDFARSFANVGEQFFLGRKTGVVGALFCQ